MHILTISDVYFPRVNGVSTSIQTFSRELIDLGHKVTLIAPEYPKKTFDSFPIHRIPSRYLFFDPEDRMMRSAYIRDLRENNILGPVDLIHIHTPFVAHYSGTKLARKLGLPCLETYHTFFEEYLFYYIPWLPKAFLRLLARRFTVHQLKKVDHIIVPSEPMLETLRSYGVRSAASVIPTGIELERFSRGDGIKFRREFSIGPHQPMLLFLGRVAHEKNIAFLLEMLPHILEQLPETVLIIAGEGPALAGLKKRARAMNMEHNVRFVGYLDREEKLFDCYAAADCFVFASRTETQGLVLLEAMAMGLPVVSTAVMGTRDIVLPRKGSFRAKEEPGDFARQVLRLLKNPDLARQVGTEGKAFVRRWTASEMAARLESTYKVLVG